MLSRQEPISAVRWSKVYNQNTAETVPPFAIMRVVKIDDDGVYVVDKPDTSGSTVVLFNGLTAIAPKQYGQGHYEFPCTVLYDRNDGEPGDGEIWGVAADSWRLTKAKPGFQILGGNFSGFDKDGELSKGDDFTHQTTITQMPQRLVTMIQVTSLTQVADPISGALRYPAMERFLDPLTGEWSDGDPCWYVDANGS